MGTASDHQRDGQGAKPTAAWRLNGARVLVLLLNLLLWAAILGAVIIWRRSHA